MKARRIRSGSPKPVASATRSIGSLPSSTWARAASRRSARSPWPASCRSRRRRRGRNCAGSWPPAPPAARPAAARPAARAPSRAAGRSGRPARRASSRAENCDWPPGRRWYTTSCCAVRLATASPRSSAISASARSMPAVMPAEVQTLPSRTKMRSGSTPDRRVAPRKCWRRAPVRGAAPAVEQAGGGQHDRRRCRRWPRARAAAAASRSQASSDRVRLGLVACPAPPATSSVSMPAGAPQRLRRQHDARRTRHRAAGGGQRRRMR